MIHHFLRLALPALLAVAPIAAAEAQSPAMEDPAVVRLQERVDDLDVAVREATGEVERLRFELRRAQSLVESLEARLARLEAQVPPAPAEAGVAPDQSGVIAPNAAAEPAPAPSPPATDDPQAAFAAAVAQLQRGDIGAAEAGFAAFLQAHPAHASSPDARYWYGQTLLARDAHREAGAQFLAIVRDAPNAARASDALAYLGVSLRRAGEAQRACQVFGQVAARVQRLSPEVRAVYERERAAARCG